MQYIFTFLVVISGFAITTNTIDVIKNDTIFVPTKEWQTVKKGISIPTGLHVRYNFQTQVTEAKLIDKSEKIENSEEKRKISTKNSVTIHSHKSFINQENIATKEKQNDKVKINFDKLKTILKEINSGDPNNLFQSKNSEPDRLNRRKFKSYSELKEELEILNMNISTDSEVLSSLFNEFEVYKQFVMSENIDLIKIQDILEILNNMEYFVHQIDNAQVFSDMGGMIKIISPCLNSTNSEIKAEALKLLGAAVQSNPKVQLKALENDFVQKLLHMLTINNKVEVKSRCLFALGALVRHFPAAQKALVNNGGLEIFGKILINGHFQIQIRIMNLINDLTIERQNLDKIQDEQYKHKDYDLTNFEYKLSMQKYCQNLVDLMIRSLKINSETDDFHKIIYESMIILSFICQNEYIDKRKILLQEIQRMLIIFDSSKINKNHKIFDFYQEKLLKKIRNIINEKYHDEL